MLLVSVYVVVMLYLCMQFFDVGALPKTNIAPENG